MPLTPVMQPMSVDLPAPFGPMSPCTSPGTPMKSTDCSACTPPKRLETPRSSRINTVTAEAAEIADHRHHEITERLRGAKEIGRQKLQVGGEQHAARAGHQRRGGEREELDWKHGDTAGAGGDLVVVHRFQQEAEIRPALQHG